MENQPTNEILQRLSSLEHKLNDLTRRVDLLEVPASRRFFPQAKPAASGPPPVLPPARRETYFAEPQQRPPYVPPAMNRIQTATQQPNAEPQQRKDTEYLIGAKILPKAGAVMMLLGLTFLVILAYSRGWITPSMMFGIEVAFCSAFVITGILKRDMKEEFGQILTGIGSCGLYLVFAGGHLYYHLYSGETLVGLFFALSLGNLALSLWRSSRSFLALGLIGGLVTASVLPNLKSDHSVLNAWIHFLILAPAALIIAKNKWTSMAMWLWAAATIALIPILTNSLVWYDKVAILYASTAICIVAHAWAYKKSILDPWNTVVPIALWITGLIGFGVDHSRMGTWQFAGFFLLFGAIALAFNKKTEVRNSLHVAAIGVPITVAPFCFPIEQAAGILASLSILAALVAWKFTPKIASMVALVEFMLATMTYLAIIPNMPWKTETTILVLLVVSVLTSARALVKAYGQKETYTLTALALCIPIVGKLSVVLFGLPEIGWRSEFSVELTLIAFTYYALALYIRTRWQSAFAAFWIVYALALSAYVTAALWMGATLDVGFLIPLMLAPALSLTSPPEKMHEAANGWVALIVGALFTRLVVVLAVPFLHWTPAEACLVGAATYAAGTFAAVWSLKKRELCYAGWFLLATACVAYANMWDFDLHGDFRSMLPLHLGLVSGLLACLVLGGRATAAVVPERKELAVVLACIGWIAFSRWSWLLLAMAIPSLDTSPAISIGWTAYFFGLIALGFAYRVAQFRYVSFFVLAATLAKIVLFDLATTDSMIRVAVTIAASLVMLAVGYWYVRAKDHSIPPASQAGV